MGRDSKGNHGGKARRSPTIISSTTASSATRSRFSAIGGPVQPLPPRGCQANSEIDMSSEAGWSNVTGFRKRLDVDGSPQSDYFISGASKFDRRAEYIGRPLTGSILGSNPNPPGPAEEEQHSDEYDEDDGDGSTIFPSDSASQVGYRRPPSKPARLFGEVGRGRQMHGVRQGEPAGLRRSHTYSNAGGGTMYEPQQAFDPGRRYSVVERKPPGI